MLSQFLADPLSILFRLARYKFAYRQLRGHERVIDVGCGDGTGTYLLRQGCRQVIGISTDPDWFVPELRARQDDDFQLLQADVFEYADSESFDVAVCLDVIEHLPPEQGPRLLDRIARLLTADGRLFLGTPSASTAQWRNKLSRRDHQHEYSRVELQALLDERFGQVIFFSMNDEIVHTGFDPLAWYLIFVAAGPRR
jgi:2-polyprenyl-3-methyl-5-hydroxy-6-metoxy-1,4-benzoquinol methylase